MPQNKYDYRLKGGKIMTLEGDEPPSDEDVESFARENKFELELNDSPDVPISSTKPIEVPPIKVDKPLNVERAGGQSNPTAERMYREDYKSKMGQEPLYGKKTDDWLKTNLSDAPSRLGKRISEWIDPSQDSSWNPRSLTSGMVESIGNLVSGMTSPREIAGNVLTAGTTGTLLKKGMGKLNTVAEKIAAPSSSIPVGNELEQAKEILRKYKMTHKGPNMAPGTEIEYAQAIDPTFKPASPDTDVLRIKELQDHAASLEPYAYTNEPSGVTDLQQQMMRRGKTPEIPQGNLSNIANDVAYGPQEKPYYKMVDGQMQQVERPVQQMDEMVSSSEPTVPIEEGPVDFEHPSQSSTEAEILPEPGPRQEAEILPEPSSYKAEIDPDQLDSDLRTAAQDKVVAASRHPEKTGMMTTAELAKISDGSIGPANPSLVEDIRQNGIRPINVKQKRSGNNTEGPMSVYGNNYGVSGEFVMDDSGRAMVAAARELGITDIPIKVVGRIPDSIPVESMGSYNQMYDKTTGKLNQPQLGNIAESVVQPQQQLPSSWNELTQQPKSKQILLNEEALAKRRAAYQATQPSPIQSIEPDIAKGGMEPPINEPPIPPQDPVPFSPFGENIPDAPAQGGTPFSPFNESVTGPSRPGTPFSQFPESGGPPNIPPETPPSIPPSNPDEVPRQLSQTTQQTTQFASMVRGPEKESILRKGLDASRSLLTTFDVSAPFRQGLGLVHKKAFWTSLDDMFKSYGSEKAYNAVQQSIIDHPSGYFKSGIDGGKSVAEKAGLSLTDLIKEPEELFRSRWADVIPGVKNSNRAYVAFLNKLRADTFANLMDDAKKAGKFNEKAGSPKFGVNVENNEVIQKQLAQFINNATGRGSLGVMEKNSKILSDIFFAPKLMASRIHTYTQVLNPKFYTQIDPMVRKEAIKSILAITGTGTMLGQVSKLIPGVEVNSDPSNSDFGKIKTGQTRMDPYGGYQQYAVGAYRMITGKSTSSVSGRITDLTAGRFGQRNRGDVFSDFFTNKLAPVPSFVWSWMQGREFDGTPFDAKKAILQRTVPIVLQDLHKLYEEDPKLLPLGIPSALGMGIQTYGR